VMRTAGSVAAVLVVFSGLVGLFDPVDLFGGRPGGPLGTATAHAQEGQVHPATRAELLRLEREAKAQALTPYEPGRLENLLIRVENERLLERLLNPAEGIYPKIGTVTPGGGLSFGPAYRRPGLLGERAVLAVYGMASLKKYWVADARLTFPDLADGTVFAELVAQGSDYPDEDFFGIGPRSRGRSDADYGLRTMLLGASAGVRPQPWLQLQGRVDRLMPDVRGQDDDDSIERVFAPPAIPGFFDRTDFVRYELAAEINTREPRGNPRTGGRYAVLLQEFDDRNLNRYGFRRIEADVQQYISLYRERRVLALRAHVSTSDPGEGQEVPFYLLRTLGGPDDLRGFERFRFRDRHLLLLQAEYRWEIFTAMDGAIFYDAGKVASRPQDLTLRDLESDYGIGFRFGTSNGVFLRVEGAFGSRGGKHLVLRFGHVF
jgi:hypothetical protein